MTEIKNNSSIHLDMNNILRELKEDIYIYRNETEIKFALAYIIKNNY